MCGIAGLINLNGEVVSPATLKRMTDAIEHRGPDGEGQWVEGNVGIGHRRLAIIDLSESAHQPMQSRDGSYILSYNGEIYNYKELRSELQKLGHRFFSNSDSEVVMHAIMEWQEKAFIRFNGMFAIAFWDCKARSLFLARDRYGIKPLYIHKSADNLIFGSEVKAIIASNLYKTTVDKSALLEYFTFQNFLASKTLYENIELLPAGSFVKIHGATGVIIPPEKYWDYHFEQPNNPLSEDEYLEEMDHLFLQAVKRQLISDVELGSYLSGGMDSGSITAIASKSIPYIKTFTCGFDLNSASGIELGFDEREKAEYMSYLFKTEHYEMVLKAGDMERIMPSLARHIEEPRVGQSYPNFYAAKLASKFVKVVLSGAGGDELFGGYPWRYYRAVINDDFDHYIDKYYLFWHRLIPNKDIRKIFNPIWSDVKDVWTRDIFKDVFSQHANLFTSPEEYVNHSLYFEAKTFLQGLLLVEDKLSMAHGLETRVPFLDNDLVDFAMKLPVSMKLGNLNEVIRINENEPGLKTAKYFEKTKDGKLLLRKAMQKYLPTEIVTREKQGFSAPDASWFRGESIDYVKQKLLGKDSTIFDFMDRQTIHNLVNEHISGQKNRRLFIWSLLSFDAWCNEFL